MPRSFCNTSNGTYTVLESYCHTFVRLVSVIQ
jgi:hypothetical protein